MKEAIVARTSKFSEDTPASDFICMHPVISELFKQFKNVDLSFLDNVVFILQHYGLELVEVLSVTDSTISLGGTLSLKVTDDLHVTENESVTRKIVKENVHLKFKRLGGHVTIVYGSLSDGTSEVHRLCFDEKIHAPTLALENEAFELWKKVRNGLALPLMNDACRKAKLKPPTHFMDLPKECFVKILKRLPAVDLTMMACSSKEMKRLFLRNILLEAAKQNPNCAENLDKNSNLACKKDAFMHRRPDNQAYYVLGHKTPNIRDLYTLGRKLGRGQFGTTYLCIDKATGIEYACKSISKRKLISKEDVEDVRREIQIMHHLAGHKNIVTIKGTYEDRLYVHIVMELCSGGELFDRVIQRGHYTERKAAELTKIVVGVVEACHSLGVMHRDLKPENFLLVNEDDDFSPKAINFGLSVFFEPGQIFTDEVGSPYYVAPEVLLKHYGPEADVWTAGFILHILLSGVPPFWAETQQGIFDAVLKGHIDFESDPWPLISDSAKDLIRKMLCSRPSERLTAHQVLCHPWICENGVAPDTALDPAVLHRLKQFSAMNKLKKMALHAIAESQSEEEIAGLREMFQAMDPDNSGAITFDELKAGLRRYGSTLKDTEIRDLVEVADVDNSGTIDYGEFIAATVHLNKLEREEHLIASFQYFDKDGSGYITVDELRQACAEHNMSDVFREDIIREADRDKSGYITVDELRQACAEHNMTV